MKRQFFVFVIIAAVLGATWLFAQEQSREDRMRQWRERQMNAISAIEAEVEKMKAGMQSMSELTGDWREMSEDERQEMREKYMALRQERDDSIQVIEEHLVMLKGWRQLREKHEKSLADLETLRSKARAEEAEGTVEAIDKMIEDKMQAYEALMKELGYDRMRRRGN